MATINESGYAKLVANFRVFIAAILKFGERYNPAKILLKIAEMQKLADRCDASMLKVSNAKADYKTALDDREKLFSQLSKLTTRIMNALKSSDTTERIDETVRSIIRKIQGVRSKSKKAAEEKMADGTEDTVKVISVSQMSYDNRINNLQDLIQLLKGIQAYKTNEPDLQIESLNKYKEDLIAKNNAVVSAFLALKTARSERNELLFNSGSGLVDIALDAKSYIKSAFGPSSSQYKQVSGLEFTVIVSHVTSSIGV